MLQSLEDGLFVERNHRTLWGNTALKQRNFFVLVKFKYGHWGVDFRFMVLCAGVCYLSFKHSAWPPCRGSRKGRDCTAIWVKESEQQSSVRHKHHSLFEILQVRHQTEVILIIARRTCILPNRVVTELNSWPVIRMDGREGQDLQAPSAQTMSREKTSIEINFFTGDVLVCHSRKRTLNKH